MFFGEGKLIECNQILHRMTYHGTKDMDTETVFLSERSVHQAEQTLTDYWNIHYVSNFTAVYLERREGEVIKRLFPGKAHLGEQYRISTFQGLILTQANLKGR